MKKLLLLLAATGFFLVMTVGSSFAEVYTYDDVYANWPGQTIFTTADQLGHPQVEQMVVTTDADGYLTRIELQIADRLIWDSLFINVSGGNTEWDKWDYYVKTDSNGVYKMYEVDQENYLYTQNLYTWIDSDGNTQPNGRYGHVNGIDTDGLSESNLLNIITYDGSVLTYLFNPGVLLDGEEFTIGYSPWCANDVFLTPVPEPATILLFGFGLLGLAGFSRKKLS